MSAMLPDVFYYSPYVIPACLPELYPRFAVLPPQLPAGYFHDFISHLGAFHGDFRFYVEFRGFGMQVKKDFSPYRPEAVLRIRYALPEPVVYNKVYHQPQVHPDNLGYLRVHLLAA